MDISNIEKAISNLLAVLGDEFGYGLKSKSERFLAEHKELGFTPEAVTGCITHFVDTELDYETEGRRGIGRMTLDTPRLGGQYRKKIAKLNDEKKYQLRGLIEGLVLDGYVSTMLVTGRPDDGTHSSDSDDIWKKWIPRIYTFDISSLGQGSYDVLMVLTADATNALLGFIDSELSGIFGGRSTSKKIAFGYILAGTSLRYSETH